MSVRSSRVYARLRTGYACTVFLEPDLWQHFGSPIAVNRRLWQKSPRDSPPTVFPHC